MKQKKRTLGGMYLRGIVTVVVVLALLLVLRRCGVIVQEWDVPASVVTQEIEG